MTIIDLKSYPFLRKISDKTLWGCTDVCRTIDFQASYGSYAATSLSPLRREIQGRFQRKNLLMSRSVSMHGFRPDYSPGKSARHRDLLTISKKETVSHGHTGKSFKINSCRSQRKTRLAHLCRIRSKSHMYSQRVIQGRLVSRRVERDSICSGWNHCRAMPVNVSLGAISKKAVVNLHTLLDLMGNFPTFVHISDGRSHDVSALDLLWLEVGAYYATD